METSHYTSVCILFSITQWRIKKTAYPHFTPNVKYSTQRMKTDRFNPRKEYLQILSKAEYQLRLKGIELCTVFEHMCS